MEMPKVTKCEVNECAYNVNNVCHAIAITIGGDTCPRCDTFCGFLMEAKGGDTGCIACVGACKVSSCIYNVALECQAPEISVGYKEQEPECLTFQTTCIADVVGNEVSSRECDANLPCETPEIFIG